MKKIILGCAAVLLSLGLLAGCNNKEDEPPIEEAVVITVDSSASVVVGESLSLTYTVSPEKAEVIAASDNQDIVTAVAQEGTLYLEGVAEGSAIVTLVGTYEGYASANKNINVSVITKEEEDTEPTTPETGGEGGDKGSYVNFSVILEDTGELGADGWIAEQEVDTEPDDENPDGDDQEDSVVAMYINGEGDNWVAGGEDWTTQRTMEVKEIDSKSVFYFNFGSTWGPSSDNFNVVIAPDEWDGDLYKDGLGPTNELKAKLGQEATDDTPFLACTTWEETSGTYDEDGDTKTWYSNKWSLAFGEIDEEYWATITDLTFVLQANFASIGWETWSEVDLVTDIYFIVDDEVVSSTITEGEPD